MQRYFDIMESKSAETSTGASAKIVLSIIGRGYFCYDNTISEHFVQVHEMVTIGSGAGREIEI